MNPSLSIFLHSCIALAALSVTAGAQVGKGLIDPNVATEKELAALPGMTEPIVKAVLGKRPFANIVALDEFLAAQKLEADARKAFYAKAFVHINLNTADSKSIQLIPGAGKRMAHEFDEYRPWKSWKQFEKEIGKYVDEAEVARLAQYAFIPLKLNTASEAEFMTIPGVGKRMAHEFDEYRPWKSKAQFEKEIGKYVKPPEVARLWRYMAIE
jgi:DNA uptake protein ComE-like DNA-binding protein